MAAGTYHVSLSSFEGPFDLLLHLIARHEVDIYHVPLAQITDDYLAVLAAAETVDLEVTTDFLVVAATLIELKAARLLPELDDPDVEDLALEARDLLYARLLDYRTFREASEWVSRRLEDSAGHWARSCGLEPRFAALRPEPEFGVDAAGFAAIAARAFAYRADREVDLSHVQPIRLTVREASERVLAALRDAGGTATFAELTAGYRHRVEVVVSFLALLELYKAERVDLEQSGPIGVLTVRRVPAADGEPPAQPAHPLIVGTE